MIFTNNSNRFSLIFVYFIRHRAFRHEGSGRMQSRRPVFSAFCLLPSALLQRAVCLFLSPPPPSPTSLRLHRPFHFPYLFRSVLLDVILGLAGSISGCIFGSMFNFKFDFGAARGQKGRPSILNNARSKIIGFGVRRCSGYRKMTPGRVSKKRCEV